MSRSCFCGQQIIEEFALCEQHLKKRNEIKNENSQHQYLCCKCERGTAIWDKLLCYCCYYNWKYYIPYKNAIMRQKANNLKKTITNSVEQSLQDIQIDDSKKCQ
ncbi:hypothetical protein BMW23_0851 [Bodo saltans virus]|uniref:Uncharacterized protein n=1 Tax=Bodo saltans virus TaxID=2024608 RepID=A0A2H4UVK3_9VIRU|nr:hypothetical protein QJ851_gp0834 [Bodo saltans virus]ATZ80897.1 hypothetical protein BMW23_0851 [Bodo saltans virus]